MLFGLFNYCPTSEKKLRNIYAWGGSFVQTDFRKVDCVWASIPETFGFLSKNACTRLKCGSAAEVTLSNLVSIRELFI